MAESATFSLVRQFAATRGVPFADVERGLYGDVPPPPFARKVAALVKNAVVALEGPARVSPLKRASSRALASEEITTERREEYQYLFDERLSIKLNSGMIERCGSNYVMPDCCAHHSTLAELGSVETWDFIESRQMGGVPFRIPRTKITPGFCSRCESVNHQVAACPFWQSDADVIRVAAIRRERRAAREVAA